MKLPALAEPDRYQGLYVFDFGTWTALGYTADEIAVLLESEPYRGGRVYRIVRTTPDGQLELRGVAPTRFQTENGVFFNRVELASARDDFDRLVKLANDDDAGIPARAFAHLAERPTNDGSSRYLTALVYPAEYDDDIAAWLLAVGFDGGDTVEGGPSHVSNYYQEQPRVIERQQLWSRSTRSSRSADEVLRTVRQALQR